MKSRSHRFPAWIALAAAIVLLSCVVFLGLEADHACIGGDCRICCQILNQISLLKNAAAVGAGLCLALLIVFPAACTMMGGSVFRRAATLVSHKVKLSN